MKRRAGVLRVWRSRRGSLPSVWRSSRPAARRRPLTASDADDTAGGEHVLVLADRVQADRGAEAGDVLVRLEVSVLAAPGVVGVGYPGDVRGSRARG